MRRVARTSIYNARLEWQTHLNAHPFSLQAADCHVPERASILLTIELCTRSASLSTVVTSRLLNGSTTKVPLTVSSLTGHVTSTVHPRAALQCARLISLFGYLLGKLSNTAWSTCMSKGLRRKIRGNVLPKGKKEKKKKGEPDS